MSLQDVGSIGELVAAIATVITLVYLSIQVRHNSRALDRSNDFAQAGSIHDITLLYNELNWRLAKMRPKSGCDQPGASRAMQGWLTSTRGRWREGRFLPRTPRASSPS